MPFLGVVRAEGFEPPRLSSREPKSRASTNSATPAKGTFGAQPIAGLTPVGPASAQDGEDRLALRPGGAAYIMPKPRRARQKIGSTNGLDKWPHTWSWHGVEVHNARTGSKPVAMPDSGLVWLAHNSALCAFSKRKMER
jgi:hypothetical protein